ncbi:S53 family peptidase [Streptomyces sp. SL13]|uniref:S53 family peptidase n=1 Tax=Streptantibioticus silvisoli TaxID=2705255 RepID=A0AA90HDZ8_9ACTN|nr:S53 family peptidase [Streptantibioticus silvisoli]MDI5973147.1 S53 family peptidase [Streptantibioticus silvisoli]
MKLDRYRTRAGLAVAATLPLVAGALAMGIPSAQAASHTRETIADTKPAWATASADRGTASSSTTVRARVYLAGRDAQGLAAYARGVSDPSSATYGKYLSAQQVKARYGATRAQVAAVTAWLKSSGLKVTASTAHYIAVSGDQAAVHKAFGTTLHNYTKAGRTYHAPAGDATVPASLDGAVLTVTGLDNAPALATHDGVTGAGTTRAAALQTATPDVMQPTAKQLPPPEAAFVNAGPFSSYYGSNTDSKLPEAYGSHAAYVVKGYTGTQLRSVYGAGKYTGKGATVAIVDAYASSYIASDAATYAKRNGDAKYAAGQLTQVLPAKYNSIASCGAAGWYGEETLDVEAVHALAPAAGITYVGAASCNDDDLMDSLSKIVDNHLADIVSNSWSGSELGETADQVAAYDQIFQQGAVEGIGFYFSSGDDGDQATATDPANVGSPVNSDWVTAVGGTSVAIGKKNNYEWETGWGTDKAALSDDGTQWTGFPGTFNGGAGGGTSTLVAQPYYQKGVVPAALSKAGGGKAMRTVPDIAAVADPNTGFLMGETQTFPDGVRYGEYRIGGTSLACPAIAALQADVQQARGGIPVGFANPAIYDRYGTPSLHDVTDHPLGQNQGIANVRVDYANSTDASGGLLTSIRTFGTDTSLHATVGYDDVTGVGTPGDGYVASYKPNKG